MNTANIPPPPADGFTAVHFDPFALRLPEFLQFGPVEGVRWYGLAYIAGFAVVAFLLYLYDRRGRISLNSDQRWSLLTAVILGTFIGGRVGYFLLYRTDELLSNPLALLRVYEGGMASHGGMIGICLAVWWFSLKYKRPFWGVADWVVTLAPPGVFFGRIANFVNGELYGKITDVPWAMHFLYWDSQSGGMRWTPPVHPSQLYAALFEGLVLGVYLQIRFWSKGAKRRPAGQLCGEALIAYAVLRVFVELFRLPDAALIAGLSRGTFYSLIMLLLGALVIFFARRRAAAQ